MLAEAKAEAEANLQQAPNAETLELQTTNEQLKIDKKALCKIFAKCFETLI